MAVFQNANLGDKLFQLAQGIIATEQKNQALLQREEGIQEQKKQNEALLAAREGELKARESKIKLDQESFELKALAAPGERAKTSAETELALARAKQVPFTATKGGLTANKRIDINQKIVNQAVAVETGQFISAWNANPKNKAGINPAQNPTEVEAERRRLRKLMITFQSSFTASASRSLSKDDFQIDEVQRQLDQLDTLIQSEEWAALVTRLRDEGPSAETRQQVKNQFFGEFGSQIDAQAEPTPITAFRYGSADRQTIDSGWQLFEEGNVDVLADTVIESGALTGQRNTQFRQEIRQRRPTEAGPEQDEFDRLSRRLLEVIRTRGTQ
ncbi:MAG: hypothetical protein V3S83_12570 [Gemmatimonadota bacterium]